MKVDPHLCQTYHCEAPAETVDIVAGFRCAQHPPRWDPDYSRYCRDAGWPGAADAYRRTHIALLARRISLLARRIEEAA